MESMVKYVLLMILVALAAQGNAVFTGSMGDPIRDSLCKEVDINNKKTVTVPQDIWPGNKGGCKYADFTCPDIKSGFCKEGSVTALIVGGESGTGDTFTLSPDAFNAIATHGAAQIGLVYIP